MVELHSKRKPKTMIYLIHKIMGNMQQDLSGALHDSLLCYEHLQILRNYSSA